MNKKIIGILVCMLLVGTVLPVSGILIIDKTTTSNISGKTLYVGGSGDGNYTNIQDAIDNASDGDTVFVFDDSSPYYEHVIVNKSINLMGEDRDTTVIDGSGVDDVVYVSADGVTVSGFTIQNCGGPLWYGAGIDICSNFTMITNNTISNNINGIYIGGSFQTKKENTIIGNTISNNEKGIFIHGSSDNTIVGNIISLNNYDGIYLLDYYIDLPPYPYSPCQNNIIKRNNISNNEETGIYLDESDKNTILKNNFLDNKIHAFFQRYWRNTWEQNYWNRPRILPKLIFGLIEIMGFPFPWFNIDWNPAQEPYDI